MPPPPNVSDLSPEMVAQRDRLKGFVQEHALTKLPGCHFQDYEHHCQWAEHSRRIAGFTYWSLQLAAHRRSCYTLLVKTGGWQYEVWPDEPEEKIIAALDQCLLLAESPSMKASIQRREYPTKLAVTIDGTPPPLAGDGGPG